jgi:uncharacterized protein (TIGR03085 family)
MSHLAAQERSALCDTLERVGPSAPTLCEPWTAAELAAHLIIRDGRPDLAPGIWIPQLSGRLDQAMVEYAARPWQESVDQIRSGPPVWSPARVPVVDHAMNLVEFFVHHEDVLRGDGGVGPRRELSAELESALWSQLQRSAGLMLRKLDVGVVLVAPGHGRKAAKGPTGVGTVALTGAPGELVLALFSRLRVSDVQLGGPDAAVARIRAAL